jgi:hypothetical protein
VGVGGGGGRQVGGARLVRKARPRHRSTKVGHTWLTNGSTSSSTVRLRSMLSFTSIDRALYETDEEVEVKEKGG